jgi:uncharacterized protein (TIGR00299 family) protein
MGASGDMLAAALLELAPSPPESLDRLNGMGIPGVVFRMEESRKCGMLGTHLEVTVGGCREGDHPHSGHGFHRSMADIERLVAEEIDLPDGIRGDVMGTYRLLAEAEGKVHGVPVSDIHFHEVGTLDAVADIAAVCMLMDEISPERVVSSPINVGSGQVRCAHGILPVPAPATECILRGVPVYSDETRGELCTPTGAALIRRFATGFGGMPVMRVEAVGHGMGRMDFEAANCLRAFYGEEESWKGSTVMLECNLDDMTPEALGFAQELLLDSGALDVFCIPAGMKKSRPGTVLCCLCGEEDSERLAGIMLTNTSTLGVRASRHRRYVLPRRTETVGTAYGDVRVKISCAGGKERMKPEYDDVSRIAREAGMTFAQAVGLAEEAYRRKRSGPPPSDGPARDVPEGHRD